MKKAISYAAIKKAIFEVYGISPSLKSSKPLKPTSAKASVKADNSSSLKPAGKRISKHEIIKANKNAVPRRHAIIVKASSEKKKSNSRKLVLS